MLLAGVKRAAGVGLITSRYLVVLLIQPSYYSNMR